MEKNVGTTERCLRLGVAIVLLSLPVLGIATGWWAVATSILAAAEIGTFLTEY